MEKENKIDLFVYIQKVLRLVEKTWKKAVICLLVCCSVLMGYKFITYSPLYTSKITFSVIKEYNGTASFTYNKEATNKLVGSFLTIIESDLMESAIKNDLKVNYIPATFSVERIGTTNLFSVYATSSNKEDAKAVLDSLAKNYTQISKVALNDASLTIIEEAQLPTSPSNTFSIKNTLLKGSILGMGIYGVILVLYVLLRQTISKASDIKVHLHSKCITSIPKIKILKEKKLLINQPLRSKGQLKDCFHKVRMEIENAKVEKGYSTFMITSTLPHEGKSMVAANTALALAKKGNQVMLVDFDLRNPTQSKNFDLAQKVGKSLRLPNTILTLYSKVDDLKLDVLSASKVEEKATEILADQEVFSILVEAKKNYDYIIIDTPPMHTMADTLVVAGYCDSYMLVIKEDFANIMDVKEAVHALKSVNNNLMGCILNQCQGSGFISNYYGYRYGYNYGYGYGYGYKNNEDKE